MKNLREMKVFGYILEFLSVLILLSYFSFCSLIKTDPDFADDIIQGPERFQFDPSRVPVIDKTTERELLEMYPNPHRKWTFKIPITKEILGRKFEMKKVISYVNYITSALPNGGYIGSDYLYFHVFFDKDEIVQQFIIDHSIKEKVDRNSPWMQGKFSNINGKRHWIDGDYWPDSVVDGSCYWAQRRDRKKFRHSEEIHCKYWESVPVY